MSTTHTIQETVIDEKQITSEALEGDAKYRLQLHELQLKEKLDFLEFRKHWSQILLSLVIGIVIFTAIFLVAVGLQWLTFEDEWLVRIIITGSFVEVLGLAKIVVDFLFKDPPADR